jgi:hypothetical protein
MGLSGDKYIADGGMVLLVARDTNQRALFKHAASLALGIGKQKADYEMHCGTEINLELAHRARPVARDGELAKMKGPFKLRMRHQALNLIVPTGFCKSVR